MNNPFNIIINKLFVALVDPISSENGLGCIKPFNRSEDFKIFIEFKKNY